MTKWMNVKEIKEVCKDRSRLRSVSTNVKKKPLCSNSVTKTSKMLLGFSITNFSITATSTDGIWINNPRVLLGTLLPNPSGITSVILCYLNLLDYLTELQLPCRVIHI